MPLSEDRALWNENYSLWYGIDSNQLMISEAPEVSKTTQAIAIVLDYSPYLHGNTLLLKSIEKSISHWPGNFLPVGFIGPS